MGTGDKAKLEAGQAMERGIRTFRSSLKTSAVAVKCGTTFLQCGHPAREGENVRREVALQSQEPFPGPPERPFRELLSTHRLWVFI